MNSAEIVSLIEELGDGIDEVEEDLEPLIRDTLSATTKKLPLLEKAKLHVLIVYAIESLIFTYLRLHGVQAKEHAVFKELTRVRQYFDKIKQAENGPSPPTPRTNMSLNREAAGRIIKHDLAPNTRIDLELRERQAREALLAKKKLRELEQKLKDTKLPPSAPTAQEADPNLSEGEIEEDDITTKPQTSNMSVPAADEESADEEVEEEGKSQSRKRRKSGGKKSKTSPKFKKQKRKHSAAPVL